jgi:nicotinamidase-related amidase
MQRIFAKGGVWETPWMERILPTVVDIVARHPDRTVFTRFITPASPEEAPGQWRPYFERWRVATRDAPGGAQLDLVPALARFAPPAAIVDKPAYSAFFRSRLGGLLLDRGIRTVIVLGAETDCACCLRCSTPSISAFAWSSSRTRCAARRIRGTTP